uniref:G-protein coupled receptors family 1 profile domain-containing protein n=1 Tax=Erpetoichthys calabaricus TaxID=27687 RepID=A0A8C4RNZ2_ERPCA
MNNGTFKPVSEFILLGFPGYQDKQSKTILSSFFLFVYIVILIENILILLVILLEEKLHKPMYYFVSNLAISGIFIGTVIIPKMVANLMFNLNTISFQGCLMQAVMYSASFQVQMYVLSAMCYDRVVAVCSPLHYATVITMLKLLVLCWLLPSLSYLLLLCFALRLSFCGPHILQSCHCYHSILIKLSCTDNTINNITGLTVALTHIAVCSIVFVISYAKILISVLKIKSPGGHRKALQTCGAHLCVLSTTLLASAFVYICNRMPSFSDDARLIVTMVQNFLCPIMNPIVYALMTTEIKESVKRFLRKNLIRPMLS